MKKKKKKNRQAIADGEGEMLTLLKMNRQTERASNRMRMLVTTS